MALLIAMAFGVDSNKIEGKASWLDSESYDVVAKPAGDRVLSNAELRPLLQHLLQERFQLATHWEKKESSGYALVVAKGGAKLQPGQTGKTAKTAKDGPATAFIMQDGLVGPSLSMQTFAGMLSSPLKQPVVDRTGITGNYDIRLRFAPEGSTDSSLPSIFTAVQEQLGLKLEQQKVPIEILVIDHVEKVPTAN
jgi:uncharacterized protein (TIGR03435 family)